MKRMTPPSNSMVVFYVCLAIATLHTNTVAQIAWFLLAMVWFVRILWFEDDTFDRVNDSAKRSKAHTEPDTYT